MYYHIAHCPQKQVVVPSYAVGFIYIPGKLGCVSFITVQYYDVCKWSSTLWPAGHIPFFAHYTTSSSSSLCRCIWRYWISKILVRYILLSVCLRLSQYYQLSFLWYIGLCVFRLPISLMMNVRISVLNLNIIVKSAVWPIRHCLRSGHEKMVCTVYLSIFLWL